MVRVRGEVPESPDLLDPGGAGSWEERDAVGVEHRFGEVGGGGRIADGYVDVPRVGGGNEAAVSPGRPGVPSECATRAKLGDRLPGADPRRVVLWPSAQRTLVGTFLIPCVV